MLKSNLVKFGNYFRLFIIIIAVNVMLSHGNKAHCYTITDPVIYIRGNVTYTKTYDPAPFYSELLPVGTKYSGTIYQCDHWVTPIYSEVEMKILFDNGMYTQSPLHFVQPGGYGEYIDTFGSAGINDPRYPNGISDPKYPHSLWSFGVEHSYYLFFDGNSGSIRLLASGPTASIFSLVELSIDNASLIPFNSAPVPEPSALFFFGTGLVSLAIWKKIAKK